MTEQTERLAQIRARLDSPPYGEFLLRSREDVPYLLALLAEKDATIGRVRDLHIEDLFRGHLSNGCAVCEGGEWPCPTTLALDGQEGR